MIKEEMTPAELMDKLLFRRQFLLGPKPFAPAPGWSCRTLRHGLNLSTHPDLQVQAEALGEASVTLLGFAIDALNPARTDSEIVHSLTEGVADIRTLIALTKPLAGRWAIIYQNRDGTYLFTDPCGYRSVFYYSDGRDFWCGSQPEIIRANCRLSWSTDAELQQFLADPSFAEHQSQWVGAKTVYEGCLHLMPNHYLDVTRLEQVRFCPAEPIPARETSAVIESGRTIIQGILSGAVRRQNIVMGLTSGWDTRLLLAASRDVSEGVQYFVDRMGFLPEHHPDVRIPRLLGKRLGIDFRVRNSSVAVPGWLSSALSTNVTGARMLPTTRAIFANLRLGEERLLVEGQANEISRDAWLPYYWRWRLNPEAIPTRDIPRIFGFKGLPFVLRETDVWRKRLPDLDADRLNVLVLFAWEQRYGSWGAQYHAEADITGDVLCPFTCRLWIETMLAAPRATRAWPTYPLYRRLIESMWPEVLSIPVKPRLRPPVVTIDTEALKQRIRSCIPSPFGKAVKVLISRRDSPRRHA